MFPAGSLNQAIVRPLAAIDPFLVLLHALVTLERDAGARELVDGVVDVVDGEVEHREGRRAGDRPSGR